MNDWNPGLYLQFSTERTQPSVDLIGRIHGIAPTSIIDIGCGPGNSTQVLVSRWPDAQITGLDSSRAMIKTAQQEYPHQEWIVADAFTHKPAVRYDLVFSNAVIQWIPDHEALITRFYGILSDNGTLAVQIPLFWDMPLGKIINHTAEDDRWQSKTEGVSDLFTIHDTSFYYERLSALFRSVEMWETQYFHILESHGAILEMMRSTGLKPYLERLDGDSEKNAFEEDVLKQLKHEYPIQTNGNVLLPFKRLFFIGYKRRQ